jgi:aminopeptidase N
MKKIFCVFTLLFQLILVSAYAENGIGDTIHAVHYDIHLTGINTANNTIAGYTVVTVVSKVDSLRLIPLDFKQLTTDSVFVNGNISTFTHNGDILRILSQNTFDTGDTVHITVYYHGEPFHEGWGGFHYAGDYAFNLGVGFESIPHNLGKSWFPCIDDFTDRATYDVYATVDNGQKAVCGGILVDTLENGNGTKTWHWELPHPIPTYLISVASGNYVLYSDTYYGIEDTIPICIYTRPSEQNNVAGSFVNLKNILNFYETHFGPYPFGRVGYVGTALGAMEHAANIAYPHSVINGNTTYEYLYAHELSHMWFGDEVTCASAEEMWLNEGWASFCEMYYKKELYGDDVVKTEMRQRNNDVLQKTHIIDNGYWALDSVPQQYTYGSTSYDKGAVVVNTLKGYLGDDMFFDAMTAYLQANAWNSKSSADLRDFLTSYTGIDMTPFFDAWVSTPGTPHFSIDSTKVNENNGNYSVDIYLKQKYKGADYLAGNNILEITLIDDSLNCFTDTVHFSGRTGHSTIETAFRPEAVLLDLYEKIDDATVDNFKIFTQKENYKFPDTYFKIYIDSLFVKSLIQVTHHWVAPDSLKTPVYGLRLSTNRYWSVDGVFDDRIVARGRFYYNHSIYFDKELIRSDNDSVVLLYRESSGADWQPVNQSRMGTWSIGYIYTDQLKKGEYTLAAWDLQTVGQKQNNTEKNDVKVFPNPSTGKLNIIVPKEKIYTLKIYTPDAKLIKMLKFAGKNYRFNLMALNVPQGIFIVNVYNEKSLIKSKKIVFVN